MVVGNIKQKINSVEDLYVYKRAREFSRKVGDLIKRLPKTEEYNLKFQMRKAKLSITNNIAEGFGRFHYQENIQFCRQSRGSMYELIDDFNECYDESYIDDNILKSYKNEAYSLIKILNNYISSIQKAKNNSLTH